MTYVNVPRQPSIAPGAPQDRTGGVAVTLGSLNVNRLNHCRRQRVLLFEFDDDDFGFQFQFSIS
jgi:hypothetical protein